MTIGHLASEAACVVGFAVATVLIVVVFNLVLIVAGTTAPVQAAEAPIRLNIVVRSFDFKSATPLVV